MPNDPAPHDKEPKRRQRRADGELSRDRILEAAREIAAERGYEGTSIGAVSAKCGLPASSIYWHFKDKDDLLAAVIGRSFGTWLTAWQVAPEGEGREQAAAYGRQSAKTLLDSPDFIRLGLMLALERRPVEPRARAMFLQARDEAYRQVVESVQQWVPGLAEADVRSLATCALAGADGLFIAKEIGGDSVDLVALLEIHVTSLYDTAVRLANEQAGR